jgi:hypothetical protein
MILQSAMFALSAVFHSQTQRKPGNCRVASQLVIIFQVRSINSLYNNTEAYHQSNDNIDQYYFIV